MNVNSLVSIYFCRPINILELCSGMSKSYLESAWWFWVLLLSFIRQTIAAFSQGLVFPLLKQNTLCSTKCLKNFEVFHSYYLEQSHYSLPYVNFKHRFLFSQAWVVSSAHTQFNTKLNLWGHSLEIYKVLSLWMNLLSLHCSARKLPNSWLCLFNVGHT